MSCITNNFNSSFSSPPETLNYLNNHPAIDSSDKKMAAACKEISYVTRKKTDVSKRHLKILIDSTLDSMNERMKITVQEQMKMSETLIKALSGFKGLNKKRIRPIFSAKEQIFPSKERILSYLQKHQSTKAYAEVVSTNMATFFQYRILGKTAIKLYTQLVTGVLVEDLSIPRIEIEKMNQRFSQALLDCSRSP